MYALQFHSSFHSPFLIPLLTHSFKDGAFSELTCLRFENLDRSRVPPMAIDHFFDMIPALSQRLTCLGVEYSVYQDEDVNVDVVPANPDLQRTFELCENLEILRLHLRLKPDPDFSHLTKLKTLR